MSLVAAHATIKVVASGTSFILRYMVTTNSPDMYTRISPLSVHALLSPAKIIFYFAYSRLFSCGNFCNFTGKFDRLIKRRRNKLSPHYTRFIIVRHVYLRRSKWRGTGIKNEKSVRTLPSSIHWLSNPLPIMYSITYIFTEGCETHATVNASHFLFDVDNRLTTKSLIWT